jgi:hypothetical protein
MTNEPSFREQLIAKGMRDCRHFNGIQHDCCEAGVNYEELIEHGKYRIPCLKMAIGLKRDPALCEKFAAMTREEAEKEADETLSIQAKTMLAMRAAHEDAKLKRFGKGHGGHDSFPCPTGCGGHLYYRVASVNGHMHAKCETPNCVSWME